MKLIQGRELTKILKILTTITGFLILHSVVKADTTLATPATTDPSAHTQQIDSAIFNQENEALEKPKIESNCQENLKHQLQQISQQFPPQKLISYVETAKVVFSVENSVSGLPLYSEKNTQYPNSDLSCLEAQKVQSERVLIAAYVCSKGYSRDLNKKFLLIPCFNRALKKMASADSFPTFSQFAISLAESSAPLLNSDGLAGYITHRYDAYTKILKWSKVLEVQSKTQGADSAVVGTQNPGIKVKREYRNYAPLENAIKASDQLTRRQSFAEKATFVTNWLLPH